MEIGRVCVKLAGKDAGKQVVIVDKIDNTYVLIDGNVKRKRCNINHLEPLSKILKIEKSISTESLLKVMKDNGIKVKEHNKIKENKKQEQKQDEPRKTKRPARKVS